MKLVSSFVAFAVVFCAPAQAAVPLANDAAAFGSRELISGVAISPSGNKVLMLVAGPGARTVAEAFDLTSGAKTTPISSSGSPDSLDWCEFASDEQLVCEYGANVDVEGTLASFNRNITVKVDGSGLKMLGQNQSFYDSEIRQSDGYILDWLPDEGGSVLMARTYIPEAGRTGSRLVREKSGLGVDRINLSTLKGMSIISPNEAASSYMTDGRGNVRLRSHEEADGSGYVTGVEKYYYRKPDSKDWALLGSSGTDDEQTNMTPLAIERETNSLYFLRKLDGRDALYRMVLDGTGATTLVAKNDQVDIDGVSRFGRGQRVIAYNYTDDRGRTVYFDKEFDTLAAKLAK